MADSPYFFSLHSGFTLGKWLPSFAQDSSKLSSILTCFDDQITNKNTKTYTKCIKLLSRVLNMPIELKGQNYYSTVFKRINYRLSNSTFWVVITIILRFFNQLLVSYIPSSRDNNSTLGRLSSISSPPTDIFPSIVVHILSNSSPLNYYNTLALRLLLHRGSILVMSC